MMPMHSRNWLETLARLGYGARGVVYVIVGGFALLDALDRGETRDSKGALVQLLNEPFGEALLGMVALGLAGYALWRFLQAILDADHFGTDARGLAIRAGLLVSGITHVGLTVFALSLIFNWGSGGGSEESATQDWTAWLLSQPYGRWLVGALGVIVIGVGLAHGVKAWKGTFKKYLALDAQKMRWASPVCRFGLIARGVVFVIIGIFFIVAAIHSSSGQARGLSGALNALEAQTYGSILLGVVALGLVAFAVYSFIEAAYRRIDPPDLAAEVPQVIVNC